MTLLDAIKIANHQDDLHYWCRIAIRLGDNISLAKTILRERMTPEEARKYISESK